METVLFEDLQLVCWLGVAEFRYWDWGSSLMVIETPQGYLRHQGHCSSLRMKESCSSFSASY